MAAFALASVFPTTLGTTQIGLTETVRLAEVTLPTMSDWLTVSR